MDDVPDEIHQQQEEWKRQREEEAAMMLGQWGPTVSPRHRSPRSINNSRKKAAWGEANRSLIRRSQSPPAARRKEPPVEEVHEFWVRAPVTKQFDKISIDTSTAHTVSASDAAKSRAARNAA